MYLGGLWQNHITDQEKSIKMIHQKMDLIHKLSVKL